MTTALTLHEGIVAIMMRERRFTVTHVELASMNEKLQLKPQANGDWPDAAQIFLRAKNYPVFFDVDGDADLATIRLRQFGDAPGNTMANTPH